MLLQGKVQRTLYLDVFCYIYMYRCHNPKIFFLEASRISRLWLLLFSELLIYSDCFCFENLVLINSAGGITLVSLAQNTCLPVLQVKQRNISMAWHHRAQVSILRETVRQAGPRYQHNFSSVCCHFLFILIKQLL